VAVVNAVETLSEGEARGLLAAARSPAADSELYAARRVDGGWVFVWRSRARPVPLGVRPVVVTDSGVVGQVSFGEHSSTAIRRLNGDQTRVDLRRASGGGGDQEPPSVRTGRRALAS
jgi:hypothetical protein